MQPQGRGSIAPDCNLQATLDDQGELCVWSLHSGELECDWALAELPLYVSPASMWAWTANNQHLVLPYMMAWHPQLQPTGPRTGDLLFVDLSTGAAQAVHVHTLQGKGWLVAELCPKRHLILVHSCDIGPRLLPKVFDCRTGAAHSRQLPLVSYRAVWAPSGKHVAVTCGEAQQWKSVALWSVDTGALLHLEGTAVCLRSVWAMPCISRVFLHLHRIRGASSAAVARTEGPMEACALQEPGELCLAWGARLVSQAAEQDSSTCLKLYAASGNYFALQRVIPARARRFDRTMELSTDGELGAILTGRHTPGGLQSRCLALIHLASGTVRGYPLLKPQLADTAKVSDLRMQWRLDNVAVLVRLWDGSCCELFCFA